MGQMIYDEVHATECAEKFIKASKQLPENFEEVVKVFDKYADNSGSQALMNRHKEVQEIYTKKIIPVSETLETIGKKILAKIEELRANDEKSAD